MTKHYLDVAGVGAWFGVPGTTVTTWRTRYAEKHPCPEPDVLVGNRYAGWSAEREEEWRIWHRSRVGQGVGGTAARKSRR